MGRLRAVVLVEANPLEALVLGRAFAAAAPSWTLVHCPDGSAALTYLQRPKDEKLGLVILDCDNALDENLALLRYLKQDPTYRSLSTLLLTGAGQSQTLAAHRRLGAEDYLIKPPDYDLLHREVVHFLHRWATRSIAAA